MQRTRIQVTKGEVIVNEASIIRCYGDLALVHLDLSTKYAELGSWGSGGGGGPVVMLKANASTVQTDQTRPGVRTLVEFLDFTHGWEIEAATLSRYTLRLCLSKTEEP